MPLPHAPHLDCTLADVERELRTMNRSEPAREIRALKAKAPNAELAAIAEGTARVFETVGRKAVTLALEPVAGGGPLAAARSNLRRDCIRLAQDPQKRATLVAVAKILCRAPQATVTDQERAIVRALTTGDSGLGQATALDQPLSEDVYVLLSKYAAVRTMGLLPMNSGVKRFASVSGKPTASWYQASAQGTAIAATASLAGSSISPEVATLGSLLEVSGEVFGDGDVTIASALVMAIVEGLGYGLDYTACRGDGTADVVNGGQTGIFVHGDVPTVNAAAGNTSVAALSADDFANLIGGVSPTAFAHPCRFWIACELFPKLLKIRDGEGRLLKPPTTPDGEWSVLGFPITWVGAGAAPSTDSAGEKVAAFGREDAYTVGLRQDFEIMASHTGASFLMNSHLLRGVARARCLMRDATSLATLKLALT